MIKPCLDNVGLFGSENLPKLKWGHREIAGALHTQGIYVSSSRASVARQFAFGCQRNNGVCEGISRQGVQKLAEHRLRATDRQRIDDVNDTDGF